MVIALENLLGSLGPQITAMMSRALKLDKKREGASNVLLEDDNAAAILELTKEKLAGQIVAGMCTFKLLNIITLKWYFSSLGMTNIRLFNWREAFSVFMC